MKKITTILFVGLASIALVACSSNTGKKEDSKASEAKTEQSSSSTATEDPNVSSEFKAALKKAKSYSKTVHLSKEGMVKQLTEFDKFPEDAVQYAVENAGIDWKKDAVEKAKSYQKTVGLSNEALKNQLTQFDNFTDDEAQYAIDHLE